MYEVNNERVLAMFIDLVKISSPSWRERGVIEYISSVLKRLDVPLTLYPCGESHNILARIDGDASIKPVLFSCHMDTVTPCEGVRPVIAKNKISSDGTTVLGSDDKAAVAAFLEAMHILREQKPRHGPIEFLFSCAEEVGLHGIKGFDLTRLNADYAFVFDSGGDVGKIVLEAPSQVILELAVRGRAAHAGIEPEKGVSAIRVLSEILSAIPNGRIDSETTCNAGIIAGGKATNIVADDAYCKLEFRSISRTKLAAVEKKIRDISAATAKRHGARVKIVRHLEYTGFSISKESPVARIASAALRKMRIEPVYESSGGGSDTNVINRAGIKAINLSSGMRNVHTTREYILKRDLVNCARLVLALIDAV